MTETTSPALAEAPVQSSDHPFTFDRLRAMSATALAIDLVPIANALNAFAARYDVVTHLRRAHFIAQVCEESAGFRRMVENLDYSDPSRIAHFLRSAFDLDHDKQIDDLEVEFAAGFMHQPERLAGYAYANKMGNGPESSGDGWRYRGRGLIQLTGRANYLARGNEMGIDLIADPARASEPAIAARAALSFWKARGCNHAADADDVQSVTRLVNGGLNGLAERERLTARAKTIFV